MPNCYLILGTNLGNKLQNLLSATEHIKEKAGMVVKISSIYETEAWGKQSENSYLNQALELYTDLAPEELLLCLLKIEADLGRIRKGKWDDRTMDIDILLYGQEIINTTQLTIPHAMMADRRFVLLPLNEIAPHVNHPIFRKNIEALLLECLDPGKVEKLLCF